MTDVFGTEVDRVKVPPPTGAEVNAANPASMLAAERHIACERRGGRLDQVSPLTVRSKPANRPSEPVIAE
ncbi:hypothetical protein [Burkholderia aenigmatica]|uniref:hypothetical protein n=1 Tax=Burkholderia aenigmatica TaxID=2015348 RepID=UPI0011775770|nr:hypothetical protein [Burkholderia aenigmatica]